MTRDDIIRMAREAGIGWLERAEGITEFLEHFAALVISQHVRESRPDTNADEEKWLQQIAYQHGGIGDLASHELEFGAMVARAEREACAKVCEVPIDEIQITDDCSQTLYKDYQECAAAIRARGQE